MYIIIWSHLFIWHPYLQTSWWQRHWYLSANLNDVGYTLLRGCRTIALEKATFGIFCHSLAGEFLSYAIVIFLILDFFSTFKNHLYGFRILCYICLLHTRLPARISILLCKKYKPSSSTLKVHFIVPLLNSHFLLMKSFDMEIDSVIFMKLLYGQACAVMLVRSLGAYNDSSRSDWRTRCYSGNKM